MRTGLHIPALTLVVSLLLGTTVTTLVYRQERGIRDEMLAGTLVEFSHRTRERVNQFVALLTATAAYVGTRPVEPVPKERFLSYVSALGDLEALSGVQGIGLALLVPKGREAELTTRLQREHGPRARVWRLPPEGATGEEEDQPWRSAIVLLAPEDERNRVAIGYDMYSEPHRRWAMERARRTGSPSLSPPVKLVQEIEGDHQVGTLIYVYSDGRFGAEGEGYIYSPMRMGHLFDVLTEGVDMRYLHVVDLDYPEMPLYVSPGHSQRDMSQLVATSTDLEVGGRVWRLTSYTPKILGGWFTQTPVAFLIGIASVLLALSFTAAIHGLAVNLRNGRELAVVQARLLADKDLHLREMSHRLKNVLARVVAMARQAARHAGTKEDFVTAMNQRLQAMAIAQDLLTRSATDGAELRDLLVAEISQIYGDAQEVSRIEGPRVILSAQQTQALGLSTHELATNALKYGAGAIVGARLEISWTLEQMPEGHQVHLLWEEWTGVASREPEHKGFGTRLLESCITLELGGEVTREYHEDGLRVRISFPLEG